MASISVLIINCPVWPQFPLVGSILGILSLVLLSFITWILRGYIPSAAIRFNEF